LPLIARQQRAQGLETQQDSVTHDSLINHQRICEALFED
jgi:hypothetical protein